MGLPYGEAHRNSSIATGSGSSFRIISFSLSSIVTGSSNGSPRFLTSSWYGASGLSSSMNRDQEHGR